MIKSGILFNVHREYVKAVAALKRRGIGLRR